MRTSIGAGLLFVVVISPLFGSESDAALRDRLDRETAQAQSRIAPNAIASSGSHYWLLIGAAGSVAGSFGTHFQSDMMISNHRSVPQVVAITWCAQAQSCLNGFELLDVTIPANSAINMPDIVGAYLGKSGLGALDLRARTSAGGSLDTAAKIDATSRIWTPMANSVGTIFAGGTSSQSFPSANVQALLSGSPNGTILGLRQDANFRTNIGIYNDDRVNAHTFTIRIIGTSGQTTFTMTVPAFAMVQQAVPAGSYGNIGAVITPDSSALGWSAYGSSNDNISGDGWVQLASQND